MTGVQTQFPDRGFPLPLRPILNTEHSTPNAPTPHRAPIRNTALLKSMWPLYQKPRKSGLSTR